MEPLPLTESLALRPVSSHDLDDLLALVEREQAHLARWMTWAEAPQRRGTAEFLEAAEAQLARGDGAHFAITDDERIVGVVGFHGIDWRNLSPRIGDWLAAA